jgi:hypothetical protein
MQSRKPWPTSSISNLDEDFADKKKNLLWESTSNSVGRFLNYIKNLRFPFLKNRGIPVLVPHTKMEPSVWFRSGSLGGVFQVSVPVPVLEIRTDSSPVPGNRVQNCN